MIKQYIPPPLRKILSRGNTYHQRLNLLRQMKLQTEGKTDGDADILRQTIALNALENVSLFENALPDKAGWQITARFEPGLHGQASIARDDDRNGLIDISVESKTLDQIADGYDKIPFIKMDLERAEPMALAGAQHSLRRTRVMMVKVWDPETDPTPRFLHEAGFTITWHGLDTLAVRDF